MSDMSWYYALSGSRHGPFTFEQMQGFLTANTINADTQVWPGSGDWISLKDTDLGKNIQRPSGPPPLAASEIDNRFVWALVGVQLAGGLIEYLSGVSIWWAFLILNIGLCVVDEKRLKAAGHEAPQSFWAIIVPVYLWKRANLLSQEKHYFYGWIAAFGLSVLLSAIGGESAIEKAACPIVTDIIHKQFYQKTSCIAVTIDEEVKSGFYRATAILDNGNEIDITIEEKGKDILVRVPRQ
jgi:hypothetical protein